MEVNAAALISAGVKSAPAELFADPLAAAVQRFDIASCDQLAAFLAHCIHESQGFTCLEENLRYSNPIRIAEIFRHSFDLNADRRISPDEIDFARGFVMQPEKLANRAYANRNGNGGESSGDGWRFRGGGLFQLTGRDNYAAASAALGFDYVADPDLVRKTAVHAALTAGWFWAQAGCNEIMADASDFDATTRRINGPGMLGAAERRNIFAAIKRAMQC